MLVYFKNKDRNITEINVEHKESMEELVNKFQKLGGVKKVRLAMFRYACLFLPIKFRGVSRKKSI